DGDALLLRGADGEPRDPALVLDAELPRAVDAALPEDHRREPIDAVVVPDVLVRGALAASVRRVEVEGPRLRGAEGEVFVAVAPLILDDLHVLHAAVDLVGAGVEQ